VVTLIVFPETMNHSVLDGVCGMLEGVRSLLEMQDRVLEDGGAGKGLLEEIKNKRATVITALQQCQLFIRFLHILAFYADTSCAFCSIGDFGSY
jgi:hypothetical protein